jgi:hypothetical protein
MTLQIRDLPYDSFLEITNQMDDQTLLAYCCVDKTAQKFCDDNFWLYRIHERDMKELLSHRNLYPNLKEFYLNIRNHVIYTLTYVRMKDGGLIHKFRYFSDINSAYNTLLTLRSNDLIKSTSIGIDIVKHEKHARMQCIICTDDRASGHHLNPLILQYPPLTTRPLICEIPRLFGGIFKIKRNVTTDFLREYHARSYKDIRLIEIGTPPVSIRMSPLVYGYISVRSRADQVMVLVDYSLVPGANSTNYSIVVAPLPQPGDGDLIALARKGSHEATGEDLLFHLEQHGTFYKFEELPKVMDMLR